MGNRTGIYVRLSDEDRYKKDKSDDSESIVNQKSMLLKYASQHGWEVVNIYSDDDYSGANINRPQFQQLLKDCEDGLIDIVLCKTQSRLTRDMEVVEKYIHNKFIEWGIRFVGVLDNADTEIEGNKKSRQINGLINEWYLEDLSSNIRKSLQNRREDGLYLGSFAPYGYIKDPENKNKLIIDPIAGEIVKEIFHLYKLGIGYYGIAETLNKKGVLTPTNYKKSNGSNYVCRMAKYKEKTRWSQDSIAKILKNEVYIGNLVQGKRTNVSYKNHKCILKPEDKWTRVCGTHEAIVDMETWKEVQEKIKNRKKTSKTIGKIYMLSMKVYCKECGSVFVRKLSRTKDGKTPYMKCKSRRLASRECPNKFAIRCDVLEKYLIEEINKQLDIYYSFDELERNYQLEKKTFDSQFLFKRDALITEKENLQEKVDKKNEYYTAMYEDRLSGIISQEEFKMFRDKFQKEIIDYKRRIEVINEDLKSVSSQEENIKYSTHILKKYRHIDTLTKEIIDEFVDVIRVGKLDEINNSRDIDIYLNIINLR